MKRPLFLALRAALVGATLALVTPFSVCAKDIPMADAFAVLDIVHAKVPYHEDLDIHLEGEGIFAIAFWAAAHGHPAGSALLKKSGGNWSLVKLTSGTFNDAPALEALGVPATNAKALVTDVQDDRDR